MKEMKSIYRSPIIEKVELDNEISLTLDSTGGTPWEDPLTELLQKPVNDSHLA